MASNEDERARAAATERPAAFAVPLLLCAAAALLVPLRWHFDDSDAQLYQVLARNLAEARRWLDPGFATGSLLPFREHLPFGLWPLAASVRLFGEGALPLWPVACSLGTVALVLWLGARLLHLRAGLVAALLLVLNESFVIYGARPRLDPTLVLFALCAAAPALLGPLRGRALALAAGCGALAALVKGPFGLVPLAAAGVARALLVERGDDAPPRAMLRDLAAVALALSLAALPAALFLLYDRGHGGSYWAGYALAQVLASARGVRPDGSTAFYFPLQSLAGRFWPGLPLALLGFAQVLHVPLPAPLRATRGGRPAVKLLALSCALAIALLCVPGRKVWNHELVAYPLLALLGGAALDGLLARAPRRLCAPALLGLGLAACVLSAFEAARRVPCVASSEFAARLGALAPGAPLLVVAAEPDWHTMQAVAAERRLSPWPLAALPSEAALPPAAGPEEPLRARALESRRARVALVHGPTAPPAAPWRVEQTARDGLWLLVSR